MKRKTYIENKELITKRNKEIKKNENKKEFFKKIRLIKKELHNMIYRNEFKFDVRFRFNDEDSLNYIDGNIKLMSYKGDSRSEFFFVNRDWGIDSYDFNTITIDKILMVIDKIIQKDFKKCYECGKHFVPDVKHWNHADGDSYFKSLCIPCINIEKSKSSMYLDTKKYEKDKEYAKQCDKNFEAYYLLYSK